MATELADRLLMAGLADQPVLTVQVHALIKAARLLQERGEPWPPLVTQALYELSGMTEEEAAEGGELSSEPALVQDDATKPEAQGDERGVRRFLKLLKGE
ncbi:hypothetical protein [Methylobacterium durans]|uniref:Uncharacterized protein n=1 Tax=Methylobacterium durans TaxID=2202825 RepID=A0A2U8W5V8_9HYPH|nr:hypothetical protein [Methylobacterium durans]AWN40752.1 hypothetical protein DK389_09720 [Methylobacterium durans]